MSAWVPDAAEHLDEDDGVEGALLDTHVGQSATVLDVDGHHLCLALKGRAAGLDRGKERGQELLEGFDEIQARDLEMTDFLFSFRIESRGEMG